MSLKPKKKKKTPSTGNRRRSGKREPSPSSHVYHFDIGPPMEHRPKCGRRNAKLFTKDKRIFRDPMYAFKQGKQPCEFCRRRLEKE